MSVEPGRAMRRISKDGLISPLEEIDKHGLIDKFYRIDGNKTIEAIQDGLLDANQRYCIGMGSNIEKLNVISIMHEWWTHPSSPNLSQELYDFGWEPCRIDTQCILALAKTAESLALASVMRAEQPQFRDLTVSQKHSLIAQALNAGTAEHMDLAGTDWDPNIYADIHSWGSQDPRQKNAKFKMFLHHLDGINPEPLRILLAHGADINHIDTTGFPLFYEAFKVRDQDAMKTLLLHGANVDLEMASQPGKTVLEHYLVQLTKGMRPERSSAHLETLQCMNMAMGMSRQGLSQRCQSKLPEGWNYGPMVYLIEYGDPELFMARVTAMKEGDILLGDPVSTPLGTMTLKDFAALKGNEVIVDLMRSLLAREQADELLAEMLFSKQSKRFDV